MSQAHMRRPWPKKRMDYTFPKFTICEILRAIYHKIDDEEAKYLCRVGITTAKAIDKKLRGYKRDWDEGFYPDTDPGMREKT